MFLEFERVADTGLLVAVGVAVFVFAAIFLALVAGGARRRIAGRDVGPGLAGALSATAGASIGAMLLFAPDAIVAVPLVLVVGALVVSGLRTGRRVQVGWLLLGTGVPIAMTWLLILAGQVGILGGPDATPGATPGEVSLSVFAWLAAGFALSVL